MDTATRNSVVPATLTDSSSPTREVDEESRTATLADGQGAKSTSESTVTPVPARPLSLQPEVDPTPPATRPTSDPAPQTLERHLSSNTDGPYPARYSRHGAQTTLGEFEHLARGTSKDRDFLPRRATLLAQGYPSIPSDLVPKTTLQPKCTVGDRIQPTVDAAEHERAKYAAKAAWTGYALNIAIGLQVLLGSLTTGLRHDRNTWRVTWALATLVASYLARMRGSNEPELSITRVKDLDQFLRDCRAFQLDHGQTHGTSENGLDKRVEELRSRFEELLGNGDGQRKLSSV
ncbi:hypothetical protein EDD22DRAFT_987207 [Suillus occidentalis]|nr:hypothetical protein EDD22DRAFT_987207 [Suillus occidentalis]